MSGSCHVEAEYSLVVKEIIFPQAIVLDPIPLRAGLSVLEEMSPLRKEGACILTMWITSSLTGRPGPYFSKVTMDGALRPKAGCMAS